MQPAKRYPHARMCATPPFLMSFGSIQDNCTTQFVNKDHVDEEQDKDPHLAMREAITSLDPEVSPHPPFLSLSSGLPTHVPFPISVPFPVSTCPISCAHVSAAVPEHPQASARRHEPLRGKLGTSLDLACAPWHALVDADLLLCLVSRQQHISSGRVSRSWRMSAASALTTFQSVSELELTNQTMYNGLSHRERHKQRHRQIPESRASIPF